MYTVRCESCASRYRIPAQRVGERGTKIKCPACGSSIVVRPAGAPARQDDPPTEDWTPEAITDRAPPVIGERDPIPEDVPSAIKALFAGNGELLTVHPPGTVPPVQRSVAPAPPRVASVLPGPPPVAPGAAPDRRSVNPVDRPAEPSRIPSNPPHQALSVTPPPPRAAASPAAFQAMLAERATPPSAAIRASLGSPRDNRRPLRTEDPPPYGVHTIPPPALRDDGPRPLDGQRTAPAAPNRPATGGGSPPRATYGSEPPPEPTPTYAPPWGATPGAPPPWQAYGSPTATGAPAPQYGTHPGAPWAGAYPTHPGAPWATHPGLTYAPPWGTGVPAGTHPGPPMVTSWQPTWVPAVVLGMERRTLVALLGVVGIVGFIGACMGVGSSQMAAGVGSLLGGSRAETVLVPATPRARVAVEPGEPTSGSSTPGQPTAGQPTPPTPAGQPTTAPPSGAGPTSGAVGRPAGAAVLAGAPGQAVRDADGGVRVRVVRPASADLRGATVSGTRPGSAPFDVDPSDVRDPWAEAATPSPAP